MKYISVLILLIATSLSVCGKLKSQQKQGPFWGYNGNVKSVRTISYDKNGNIYWNVFGFDLDRFDKFDKKGRIVSSTTYHHEEYYSKTIFKWKGLNLIDETEYDVKHKKEYKIRRKYRNQEIVKLIKSSYDSNGLKDKLKSLFSYKHLSDSVKCVEVLCESVLKGDKQTLFTENCEFANDLPTKLVHNSGNETSVTTYRYKDNRLIEQKSEYTTYASYYEDGLVESVTNGYIYGNTGIRVDNTNSQIIIRYKYEKDNHGNWIRCFAFKDGEDEPYGTIERAIEYYK